MGLAGIRRTAKGAVLWGAAAGGYGPSPYQATPLLDEPLAGLAAAERQRVGDLDQAKPTISSALVEHDIDRVSRSLTP